MHVSAHLTRSERATPHAIHLELERASYQPGEAIRGRVTVHVAIDDDCESLSVELQMHGRGEVQTVTMLASERLFAGAWRAGERHVYPFSITALAHAQSHRGQLFQLEPRLAAVLVATSTRGEPNVGNALLRFVGVPREALHARAYPAAAQPIAIAADPRPLGLAVDAAALAPARIGRAAGLRNALLQVAVGLVLLAAGAAMALSLVGDINPWIALAPGCLGLILALAGGRNTVARLRAGLAELKIGVPHIQAQPRHGVLDVGVRTAAAVAGAHATLRLVEVLITPGADHDIVNTRTAAEQSFALRALAPGAYGAALPLPGGWPVSIDLGAAGLAWRLVVTLTLDGWPDWEHDIPLAARRAGEPPTVPPQARLTFE